MATYNNIKKIKIGNNVFNLYDSGNTTYGAGDGLNLSGTTFSSKNSNLLNGSSTGSIRSTSSASEASGYTLGTYAVTLGKDTQATGQSSVALNAGTIAAADYQTVMGTYNSTSEDYALIIGNGTNGSRSNALTIDWDGRINIPQANGHIISINNNTASTETFFTAVRTDTDIALDIGVGNSGNNHGIYSSGTNGLGGWICHSDGTNVYLQSSKVRINSSGSILLPVGANYVCQYNTLNLGSLQTVGLLSSTSSLLSFSIPTGRVLYSNKSIANVSFDIVARAGNSNGAGLYIIRNSSSGTSSITFNSNSSSTFYNGAGTSKTITSSMVTATIQGNTNIFIYINSGSNYFFGGNATNNGYVNNNPVVVTLSDIVVTFN